MIIALTSKSWYLFSMISSVVVDRESQRSAQEQSALQIESKIFVEFSRATTSKILISNNEKIMRLEIYDDRFIYSVTITYLFVLFL